MSKVAHIYYDRHELTETWSGPEGPAKIKKIVYSFFCGQRTEGLIFPGDENIPVKESNKPFPPSCKRCKRNLDLFKKWQRGSQFRTVQAQSGSEK